MGEVFWGGFCRAPKSAPEKAFFFVNGSALLPVAIFRVGGQQVDDEPMLCFHLLYRRDLARQNCYTILTRRIRLNMYHLYILLNKYRTKTYTGCRRCG